MGTNAEGPPGARPHPATCMRTRHLFCSRLFNRWRFINTYARSRPPGGRQLSGQASLAIEGPLAIIISSPHPQPKSKTNALLKTARRCRRSDAEDKIQSCGAATKELTKPQRCDPVMSLKVRTSHIKGVPQSVPRFHHPATPPRQTSQSAQPQA